MIDFRKLDHNVVIARGQYSIVRGKREECLKLMQRICEDGRIMLATILADVQDKRSIENPINFMRNSIDSLEKLVKEIADLDTQLGLIKPLAFPE